MLKGINHIGIAVKNLDEATKAYITLGAKLEGIHEIPPAGMKAAMIWVGSDTKLELLEAISPESPVAKFIESRGEGIQHICFEVDDIDKELASLSAKGVQLIDKVARTGISGRIAFLHPKSMNGVLVELLEARPPRTGR